MVRIHSTLPKWAKKMPDATVETTTVKPWWHKCGMNPQLWIIVGEYLNYICDKTRVKTYEVN